VSKHIRVNGPLNAALTEARKVTRAQFTIDDLKRNLDYICKDMTPEQIYDLYERIYITIEGKK